MRSRTPALATWLLERFGAYNQPLIGDLMEEYRAGRSAFWYWRQVFVAILIGSFAQLRAHRILTIRALALGHLSIWLGATAVAGLFRSLINPLLQRGTLPVREIIQLDQLCWVLIMSLVYVGVGWTVGRTHRPYSMAMVLPVLTTMMLLNLPWLCRLLWDTWTNLRFLPYLETVLLYHLLMIAGMIAGGLLGSGRNLRQADLL